MSCSGNSSVLPMLAGLELTRPNEPLIGGLLRIGLGVTRKCNLACSYCLSEATEINHEEIQSSDYRKLLTEARGLGALTVAFIGEGDPLCFPIFVEVLEIAVELGMKPVLFTNGTLLTSGLVRILWETGSSVIVKLNSLNSDIHDRLVGVPGTHGKAMTALKALLDVGFADSHPTRLGIESVIVGTNSSSLMALWCFCRQHNVFPYFETLKRCGRAASASELVMSMEDLRALFHRIQKWDIKYSGLQWDAHPPHVGFTCQQHYFSCFVRANGDVTPCSGLPIVLGNTLRQPLAEILRHPLFIKLRTTSDYLKGKCGTCRLKDRCYGCRANALFVGGGIFEEDPDCWIHS